MSTHNIRFYGEITKMIPKLSLNTHLICSTELWPDIGVYLLAHLSAQCFVDVFVSINSRVNSSSDALYPQTVRAEFVYRFFTSCSLTVLLFTYY